MNNVRILSLCGVVCALVSAAQAQLVITTGAGSAVSSPTNVATFEGVSDYSDLSSYMEDGLSVTLPTYAYTDFDPTNGSGGSGFSGGFFYPSGGVNGATLIARADGTPITSLEFVAGTGFYNGTTTNLAFFGVRGGSVYSTTTLDVLSGSVVGVSDAMGFDALYVGAYSSSAVAQSADTSSYQALALDNLKVQAVPEPASMAALGLGALAMLKRRRKG